MLYRAALIDNSYQSIISNYLDNKNPDILDKSLYEFLHSLPYLKSNSDDDEKFKDQSRKNNLKSLSAHEFCNFRKSSSATNSSSYSSRTL